MSKNSQVDYTQYVHKFTDENGKIYFAVGEWNQERGQYTCPLDAHTRELTGCFAEFARTPQGLGAYSASRQKALRRARYLFGQRQSE